MNFLKKLNSELPFIEKYRPYNLDELIVPDRVMEKFSNGIKTNMILFGTPGTGKTSTAKALINHFGYAKLWINASLEGRIEVIREDITNFCSQYAIDDDSGTKKLKVVVLDEVERASDAFFDAFRGTVEKFAGTTRFILTTNYIDKIPAPILSRFEQLNFDFEEKEEKELLKKYLKRIKSIATNENIQIEDKAIIELVKRKYPDMRSILNTLEGYKSENRPITIADLEKFHGKYKDMFEFICTNFDPIKNYEYFISNYQSKVDDVLYTLGTDFIDYIKTDKPALSNFIPNIIITVCQHQSIRDKVLDPAITMLSCVYEIQNIIKKV